MRVPRNAAGKVFNMINQGIPVGDIKTELGLRSVAQVRELYLQGLVAKGVAKKLNMGEKSARGRKPAQSIRSVIGRRGSLTLSSKVLIEKLGFKAGDTFKITKRKNSIVLRPVKE